MYINEILWAKKIRIFTSDIKTVDKQKKTNLSKKKTIVVFSFFWYKVFTWQWNYTKNILTQYPLTRFRRQMARSVEDLKCLN